jgi:5,6-dimethylbenzimidazole synthase
MTTIAPAYDQSFRAELKSLLHWRRDVRKFRADAVDEALFQEILDTAGLAPSVGLSEPWRLVTVDEPGRREAIRANFCRCNEAALAAQEGGDRAGLYARLKLEGLQQAPRQVAVFVDPDPEQGSGLGRQTMPETVAYSAVLAVHTMWLTARAAGLGLGWVSILEADAVRDALEVDRSWRLIAYLCLGYPAQESHTPELERVGWERRRRLPPLRR